MAFKCKECGCTCKKCQSSDHDVQLHVEIENLKQKLLEKENHIVTMETNFLNEANKFPSGEMTAVKEELLTWQDKYRRLYEAHRRVQRVNQGLEDKLLKLVDVCETDKNTLTKDVATLSHNLAEANYAIKKLTDDNERYKNDVSLAIQFLQCKQANFVQHRFDSLPTEVQTQVSAYMTNKRKPFEEKKVEPKSIKVPIPTFPPTAMVYSVPKESVPEETDPPQVDIVSAAIMAKVLEERQKERALAKHCDSCTCAKNLRIIYEVNNHHVGCQTNEGKDNLCLKCNDKIQNPIKLLKPVEEKVAAIDSNVVKVQPNNFLMEPDLSCDLIDFNDVTVTTVNEKPAVHFKFCDQKSNSFESEEKKDSEKRIVFAESPPKGPRYASMRLQGSKNILLDNAHNNVAPVLYTRGHNVTRPDNSQIQKAPKASTKHPGSSSHKPGTSTSSSCTSKQISVVSENSDQHQQRISDWVQITVDNDNISSPDRSRTEDLKIDPQKEMEIKIDKVRYAEMEENVKRFLFGESDFWKTVEIGKLKYKSFQDVEKLSKDGSRTTSHTETDI